MVQNGVIETSTGDLLRCGFCTFTAGPGETLRSDVPVPGYRRGDPSLTNMHRWNGAAWVEVPQPAITTCHTSCMGNAMRAVIDSDEDSDQSAGNEHKWEVWDGHPDNGGVVAFKVSLVNNIVTLSTPMSGGISFGDVQVNSLGVGVVPSGGTGQIDTASVIRAAGGSAGVPSFSFTNDIDTGVYRVTADQIGFATSGVLRVRIDNSNLRLYVGQVWNTDNTNDVGASGTLRPRTQYLGTALNVGSPVVSTGVGHIRAGDGTRLLKWDAATGGLDVTGAGASLGIGVAASGTSGNITAGGSSGTLTWDEPSVRLRMANAAGTASFNIRNTTVAGEPYIRYDTAGNVVLESGSTGGSALYLNVDNHHNIYASGPMYFTGDNLYDHGASGASRPRTGYFGTALNVGDGVVVTTVNGSAAFGDGTRLLKWDAAAGLLAATGTTARVGIGTSTVPHGGVGGGRFAINGANVSVANGPHIQITTDTDDYPLIQYLNYAHDNVQWFFDCYYDGATRSSDAGSNFSITKIGDYFALRYDSGIAPGAILTWNFGWRLYPTGEFQINQFCNIGGATESDSPGDLAAAVVGGVGLAFDATLRMLTVAGGTRPRIGIGTQTVPHGGVGGGRVAIEGANADLLNGPHIQVTTATDDYPLVVYLNYSHDNVQWFFDAYHDGAPRSSDAGSNFSVAKMSDTLLFRYDSGIAQGSVITWNTAITIRTTGEVVIGKALTIGGDLNHAGTKSAVNGATPTPMQTVGGSRAGNAALASLLTALETFGVISDATT